MKGRGTRRERAKKKAPGAGAWTRGRERRAITTPRVEAAGGTREVVIMGWWHGFMLIPAPT